MIAVSTSLVLTLAREPAVRVAAGPWVALGDRESALLAWLAIEGPTSRGDIARLLWPDSAPDAARSALRQRLFHLRRISGAPLVVGDRELVLAEGVEHDLAAADSVLGDRPCRVGAEFDAWLERQRGERRDRVRRALVARADAAEAERRHGEALQVARELLALEPLSEHAHRRLIRLHYLAGERPAALLAFDRCERVLKDEVGVAPSAETLALLQTIIRAEEAAAGDGRARPFVAVPAAVLRPPRRVGRADLWTMLSRRDERCRVKLLFGEAGMGKSRLLNDRMEATLGQPPSLLLVSARPGDGGLPYAVAARLLRALMASYDLAPAAAQRPALARLLPELGGEADGPLRDPARLVAAASSMLVAAAAHGLAGIAVDDLQFADDASVELLQALVAEPLLPWILAMRPHELTPVARSWIEALQGDIEVESATLEPLSIGEVAELLDSLALPGLDAAGNAGRIAALHQHTGGNPLYVLETVKASLDAPARGAEWPIAANVQRLIQQRLRRLSPLALGIARCAAVAGPDAEPRLVAELLLRTPLELADAWAELEAAQVLHGGRFAHDLIAEAALASVPATIAAVLHGDMAAFLERQAGEPARIAEHWLAAGEPRKAAPALVAAADRAMDAWRPDEAAPRYEQAAVIYADAGDRRQAFDARFQGAAALVQQAHGERLSTLHDALLDLADDEGQLAMAATFLVNTLFEQRRFDEAGDAALHAAQQARRAGLAEIEAEHLYSLGLLHWQQRQLVEATECVERACDLIAGVPPDKRILKWHLTEAQAHHVLGYFLSAAGRYDEGEARLGEARRQSLRAGDAKSVRDVDRALSGFVLERGDLARALALSASAMAWNDKTVPDAVGTAHLLTRHADLLMLDGQLGRALELHQQATALCEANATPHFAAPIRLALLHHALGRPDLARSALRTRAARAEPAALVERLHLQAALLATGAGGDPCALFDALPSIADPGTRVTLLCLAAAAADPAQLLPLLDADLAATRGLGAHGLALSLEVRRAGALLALGRGDEAVRAAMHAWQRVGEGICGGDMLPDLAAALGPALAVADPRLADSLAARAWSWLRAAATTLPPAWQDNYLARTPARSFLKAAGPLTATRAAR